MMRVVLAIALGAGLMVSSLTALDIRTLDGRTFKNCEITQVDPDGICVLFPGGGAKIKFAELPEALQAKYGYDPEKAAAYEARQAEVRRQIEAYRAAVAQARAREKKNAAQAKPASANVEATSQTESPKQVAEIESQGDTSARAPAAAPLIGGRGARGTAATPSTYQRSLVGIGAEMVQVIMAPYGGYGGGYGRGGYGGGGFYGGGYGGTGAQYVGVVLAPRRYGGYGRGGYGGYGGRGGYGGTGGYGGIVGLTRSVTTVGY